MLSIKRTFKLLIISGLILILNSSVSSGQKVNKQKDYSKYPYWIEMMDDTLTNYFEAQKAYELFWEKRIKPKEEDDIMGMRGSTEEDKKDKQSWLSKLFRGDLEKKAQQYAYQCKRFEHWEMKMEPWVQPDGRILYPYERLRIIEKSRP